MATAKPPQKLLAEIGKVDVQKMKHVKTVEENSLPSAEGRTDPSLLHLFMISSCFALI